MDLESNLKQLVKEDHNVRFVNASDRLPKEYGKYLVIDLKDGVAKTSYFGLSKSNLFKQRPWDIIWMEKIDN